jgi:hypothetical protein
MSDYSDLIKELDSYTKELNAWNGEHPSYPALIDLMNRLKEQGRKKDADICSKALYCLNRMDRRHFKHIDRIAELEAKLNEALEKRAAKPFHTIDDLMKDLHDDD